MLPLAGHCPDQVKFGALYISEKIHQKQMEMLINNTLDGFVPIFIFGLFFLHPTSTVALATSNNKFASFHQLVQHSLNFFQRRFTQSLIF